MSYTSEVSFYGKHQEDLPRLFELVGAQPEAAASLEAAVLETQPWARGDHIRPEHRVEVNETDEQELKQLYRTFGLSQEHELPPRHYKQILLLGGTFWGSNNRMLFLRKAIEEGGVTTDQIMLLGGERELFAEEMPAIKENVRVLAESNIADSWVKRLQADETAMYWETDMLRLSAVTNLGSLVVESAPVDHDDFERPHRQLFSWHGIPITMIHTAAVSRRGTKRHNTEACIRDWLNVAPSTTSCIAFIAANPHTTRVGRSANRVVDASGRHDIALLPAGPGVLPRVHHHTYLGEVARHLYEDSLLLAG